MVKQEVAEALWDLLDDIDTADDAFRDDDAGFRNYARKAVKERFKHAASDGYTLTWVDAVEPS